jgi:tetratricopeptide (TPR) repeat protein
MHVLLCLAGLAVGSSIPAAEQAIARGDYRGALEILAKVETRSAAWHVAASRAYDGLEDPARAVEEAEKALSLEPRNLAAHLQLAGIFLSRNTPQAALEIYSEAESLFPKNLLIQLGKGLALKELGRYEEAERELLACLTGHPGFALAFDALATIYLHQLRHAELKTLAEQFLKHNQLDYRGYYFLAAALEGLEEEPEEIHQLLNTSLQHNERFAAAYALRGKLFLRQGAIDQAISALQRAVQLRPDLAQAHLQLAQAYRKAGDEASAQRHFAVVREIKQRELVPRPSLRYRRSGQPGTAVQK